MDLTRRGLLTFLSAAVLPPGLRAQRGQPKAPAPQPDPEAMAKELRDSLNGLVRYEIARRGGALDSAGSNEVSVFVGQGVQRLQDKKDIANPYAVSSAIDAARRLGVEIYNQARSLGENLKQIGAGSVRAATKLLCPMYPFC